MLPSAALSTLALHAGKPSTPIERAVVTPIFQSATFFSQSADDTDYDSVRYARLNNTPNHTVLHARLAALEKTEAALVTASGMAAITTSLLTVLKPGDHLLAQDCLYGGTQTFVEHELTSLGITVSKLSQNPGEWDKQVTAKTTAIYVESITNPLMQVIDHGEVIALARRHRLVSLIDSTFASPVNFNPATLGYDIVLHSATKYLNGHSDLCAGVVCCSGDWQRRILRLLNHLGGSLDPHACFLLERGIKTLVLRVHCQNANALAIAHFLSSHPAIGAVHYAGLPNSPYHHLVRKYFSPSNGAAGGMMSFTVKDTSRVESMLRKLKYISHAVSLGGVDSLITQPSRTSHIGQPESELKRMGISDSLIRLSVGIEDINDLKADLAQALS